jgi:putative hydrolase of the HAD superfamily
MPSPFDAVLLDLYDTVAWSTWHAWQAAIAARIGAAPDAVGRAFEATRPARSVGTYADAEEELAAVIRAVGVEPTPPMLEELRDLERRDLEDNVQLYDDALPAVRALRARGVRTVLVSNCSHNTRPAVERLGLPGEFDAVVLSFELGAMKPDPAIYLAALRSAGDPDPARAVFVDDQPDYCDGAAAVGLATRLILRWDEDEPPVTNGHEVVRDLAWLTEAPAGQLDR